MTQSEKPKHPGGRPGKQPLALPEQVAALARIQCTWPEIAAVTGVPMRTLQRKFGAVYKDSVDEGKASLRRMMWKAAQDGNAGMMIFLSKQLLGYADKVESNVDLQHSQTLTVDLSWGDQLPAPQDQPQIENANPAAKADP